MSKKQFEDITGKRFSNWLVLEGKENFVLCECQCKKKTQKTQRRSVIISGDSKSCGCMRYKNSKITCKIKYGNNHPLFSNESKDKAKSNRNKSNTYEDITGKRFSNWLVLEGKEKFVLCECQCDKKTVKKLIRYVLIDGKSTTCGCKKFETYTYKKQFEDLTGKQFGNWLVLDGKGYKVDCECQCEKKTRRIMIRHKLLTKHSSSCGCQKLKNMQATCLRNNGVINPAHSKTIQQKATLNRAERNKIPDIAGQKFGNWIVVGSGDRKNVLCECQCEKRTQKFLNRHALFKGTTKSCGCQALVNLRLTNTQRYGVPNPQQNSEIRAKSWTTKLQNQNHGFSSESERELLQWVRQYYPNAHSSHTGDYQIDIWVEELKLAIEYNGLWWHSDGSQSPRDQNYHINKQKRIKEYKQGRTIFIWEHEWNTKKEQVKNFLLSVLKVHSVKIGARNCMFKAINKKISKKFLDDTHIQSSSNATIYSIGCYYNDQLISVATFSKHHRNSKQIVLNRFACLEGYTIQGGLSKFSKLASEYFKCDIVSWADLMKSDGNGYIKAGWVIEEILKPDYFYINRVYASIPISKQSRKKRLVNTPEGMTEDEHARLDGLAKVWDCGKIRLIYKYNGKSVDTEMGLCMNKKIFEDPTDKQLGNCDVWYPPVSIKFWQKRYPNLPLYNLRCKWCGYLFKELRPWLGGSLAGITTECCAICSGGGVTIAIPTTVEEQDDWNKNFRF